MVIEIVFKKFCIGFLGKVSLVYFFWGSFDLVMIRFLGCLVFEYLGGIFFLFDRVICEVYFYEVSFVGFWLGGGGIDSFIFYLYVYLVFDGFYDVLVFLFEVFYSEVLGEFILFYDVVRNFKDSEVILLSFL